MPERHRYVYMPPAKPPVPLAPSANPTMRIAGGSRVRGQRVRPGVNTNPEAQPNAAIRALNLQRSTPGPREQVYCTKVGSRRPDELALFIVRAEGRAAG
ncbi:MAG: hypothetical protein ND807_14790 [Vicinamibacterales bacterium]|nr:hypothetical protein [Vicinamibacterales bacterium]